jgi:hypothetical protein
MHKYHDIIGLLMCMRSLQVREEGTGMPDEVNYEAHLMDVKEALKLLNADEAQIVDYASKLFAWVRPPLVDFAFSFLRSYPCVDTSGRTPSAERCFRIRIRIYVVSVPSFLAA